MHTGKRFRYLNALAYRLRAVDGMFGQRDWRRVLDRVQDDFDVIHLHNSHGYYMSRGVLEDILALGCVWTLHDFWLMTGRCAMPMECTGFRGGCNPCPHLDRYPATRKDRAGREFEWKRALLDRFSPTLVTPSGETARVLSSALRPRGEIHVIHNPVFSDTDTVPSRDDARAKLGVPADTFRLTFIAAQVASARKGLNTLVEALGQSTVPSRVRLCVIGDSDAAARAILAPIARMVDPLGPVTERDQLARLYAASDLTVIPSLEETFGLTAVEAAGFGSAVLCSDLTVFREVLGDVDYFAPGDARGLRALLDRAFAGGPAADQLALAASIRRQFSAENATTEYLELYRGVAQGNG